jgi:preprotein translocase subunit SecA
MMGRFGIPEDEPVASRMVSRALESAQEKIEGFHFDTRKHTLQYDDVLNHQRTSIYGKRRKILDGDEGIVEEVFAELIAEKPELADTVKAKEEKYSKEAVHHIVRVMMLQIIDTLWMEHLDAMELEATLKNELIIFIENLDGFFAQQQAAQAAQNFVNVIPQGGGEGGSKEKIGRNDPCPCGSGKKWKKCGELNTEEHQQLMSAKAA